MSDPRSEGFKPFSPKSRGYTLIYLGLLFIALGVVMICPIAASIAYADDKLCNGTLDKVSGDKTNLCRVPENLDHVSVKSSLSDCERITNYLFDKEPGVSGEVKHYNSSNDQYLVYGSGRPRVEGFSLMKGSTIRLSFFTTQGVNISWYWTTGSYDLKEIEKNAIVSSTGNTFNLTFTAERSSAYNLVLYSDQPLSFPWDEVRGSYELNLTSLILDNPVQVCTNSTNCVFKNTAGKYVVSVFNKSTTKFEFDTDSFIVVGKEYRPVTSTVVNLAVSMVVFVVIGVIMVVVGYVLKPKSRH